MKTPKQDITHLAVARVHYQFSDTRRPPDGLQRGWYYWKVGGRGKVKKIGFKV